MLTSEAGSLRNARPNSATRAFPFVSISMFGYTNHHKHGFIDICSSTHSSEVSVNHAARVKVKETIGNTERLMMGRGDVLKLMKAE